MTGPVALVILDGWGLSDKCENNAACQANTPVLDRLRSEYQTSLLSASGRDVGLPDGQMGNSEVGHMNIGAGRIIYQDLTRISLAIEDGSFFTNPALTRVCERLVKSGGKLHLLGLLSDGGVHSHNTHLNALVRLAKQVGDFETLDDLKTRVREDLDKEAGEEVENVVRGRLLDMLLDANPFEVPASMVDRYADGVIGEQPNLDPERLEEIRASIRVEAERAVKRILIIEKVADTQGLAATEDDIDARVEEIAEANASTAAKVYASLQKAGRLEMLERELTERKVFDFLKEQSEITDSIAP